MVISNRIHLPGEISEFNFSDKSKIQEYKSRTGKDKSLLIESRKYLAKCKSLNPESEIVDAGIREVLKGNYNEAEILFKEVQDSIPDGSVENNLAVIFELTRRKKEAMIMYSKALFKSPNNSGFKYNLISFINLNYYSLENQFNLNTVK